MKIFVLILAVMAAASAAPSDFASIASRPAILPIDLTRPAPESTEVAIPEVINSPGFDDLSGITVDERRTPVVQIIVNILESQLNQPGIPIVVDSTNHLPLPETPIVALPAPIVPETPIVALPAPIVPETPMALPAPIAPETPIVALPAPIVPETPMTLPAPIAPETPMALPAPIVPETPVALPAIVPSVAVPWPSLISSLSRL